VNLLHMSAWMAYEVGNMSRNDLVGYELRNHSIFSAIVFRI